MQSGSAGRPMVTTGAPFFGAPAATGRGRPARGHRPPSTGPARVGPARCGTRRPVRTRAFESGPLIGTPAPAVRPPSRSRSPPRSRTIWTRGCPPGLAPSPGPPEEAPSREAPLSASLPMPCPRRSGRFAGGLPQTARGHAPRGHRAKGRLYADITQINAPRLPRRLPERWSVPRGGTDAVAQPLFRRCFRCGPPGRPAVTTTRTRAASTAAPPRAGAPKPGREPLTVARREPVASRAVVPDRPGRGIVR